MSNRGDAAITVVTLEILRSAFPDAKITLAANHRAEFEGLGAVVVPSFKTWVWTCDPHGRFKWRLGRFPLLLGAGLSLLVARFTRRVLGPWSGARRALLQAYAEADIVVNCGGNTLYARHTRAIAFWVIWFSQICAFLSNKPLVGLPQTVGPFHLELHRRAARLLLRRATLTMLRDSSSYDLVTRELQVDPATCVRTPDLALLLSQPYAMPAHSPPCRTIGISVLDWGAQMPHFGRQAEYEQALVATISALAAEGFRVAFFSQSDTPVWGENDAIPAGRIIEQLNDTARAAVDGILTVPHHPYQALDFLRQFHLVIATRLHAAILALAADVPIVPIAYTTKSWGFIHDFDLESIAVDIDSVTTETLLAATRAVSSHRTGWQQRNRTRLEAAQRETDFVGLLRAAVYE